MSPVANHSEIGRLRKVIVHQPGREIEKVTPATAAVSLYNDILFLDAARREHRHLAGVLSQVAEVLELVDLLADVLASPAARAALIEAVCAWEGCPDVAEALSDVDPRTLAHQLLEGVPAPRGGLAHALDPAAWALPPLPNAFFMRDAAACVGTRVVHSAMASGVRGAEALLLRAVFREHPSLAGAPVLFDGPAAHRASPVVSLEGGDLHVLRDDLLVMGCSERTSVAGIEHLLAALAADGAPRDVVVVLLPRQRATIHLDMIFSVVDRDACVVFEPLVTGRDRCRVAQARLEGGRVARVREADGLLEALGRLGAPLEPIPCGGAGPTRQVREQWSSGANLFAFAPGKVIGYVRNQGTFEALAEHGFEVVSSEDVLAGAVDVLAPGRRAVAMPGGESSRGGGGCRCMTLPVARDPV